MKFFYYKVNCFYNLLILEELHGKIHNVVLKHNQLYGSGIEFKHAQR